MDQTYRRIEGGFASLDIDPDKKERALANLRRWLTEETFADYRPSIDALAERGAWDLLAYNFFQTIPFGTGGRRGPVGVGPNTMNPWTLATSVQGHVAWMRKKFGQGAPLSVVIAFDVRVFKDMKGRYVGVQSPLHGITSRDFARMAAEVYAANGVAVHLPDPAGDWFVSTPELSFAIRTLRANGGLNVSASHNHPDDNGGKFYEERGGQEVPPNDELFSELVEQVEGFGRMPWDEGRAQGLITLLDAAVIHEAYVQENLSLTLRPAARGAHIVLSNLHGTGDTNVGEVLERAGFRVDYVPEQRPHDGQFTHVPFRIANPEVPESMGMAVDLAKRVGADLVMATDPDADRLGMMAPDRQGTWRFITGNELGSLVFDHRLTCLAEDGRMPAGAFVVKTEVTSMLPAAIATYHGARVVDGLLVGCKYIADVMANVEERGHFGPLQATLADYVAGMEESHGVLITPNIRDKDAAGAALTLAELASREKARGRTLYHALDDAHRKAGVHQTAQVSIVIEGTAGMESIARIQRGFRAQEVGGLFAGLGVTHKDDFLDESTHGAYKSGTDRSARNFLTFRLVGGARFSVRPSGTEPKIKLYVEVTEPPLGLGATDEALDASRARAATEVQRIADAVATQAYAFLGVTMPAWALRTSPLLGLAHKQDLVDAFVPELVAAAQDHSGPALVEWIEARLAPYGKDPRGLIAPAMRAWVQEQRAAGSASPALDAIHAAFA
ncbi:MAG: phosphoglucomutase [Myxococcales bacterium]